MAQYLSTLRGGRLDIRRRVTSRDKHTLLHDETLYQIGKLRSIDNEKLNNLVCKKEESKRNFGMYLIEDKKNPQLRCYNFTPYKKGKISTFNINSIYPRFNLSTPDHSVIGHWIDLNIEPDRKMISHEYESNFWGHKDLEPIYQFPEYSKGLQLIYCHQTSAIVSDELINRYTASYEENNWITRHAYYNDFIEYHNHELANDGALIVVKGDIKFNNINNERPKEAKSIRRAASIGLNFGNYNRNDKRYYERPVFVLKPKRNNDLSLYAINSELDTGMRKNKTVVIDFNQNNEIEMMTWKAGTKYILEQQKALFQQIYDYNC